MKANTTSNTRPKQINKRKPVVLNRDRSVISSPTVVEPTVETPVNDDPTVRSIVWSAYVIRPEDSARDEDYPTMSDSRYVPIDVDEAEEKKAIAVDYIQKITPLCSTDSINLLNELIKEGTLEVVVTIKDNLH